VWTTDIERQLDDTLWAAYEGDIVDVRFLPSAPDSGRPNPKVFVVVREIDVPLYERITRVTMQLADLQQGFLLNFDIVPETALPLVPMEARSIRR